ncbi:MAG: hypothetical protein AVDCRST_MAG75-3170 [uncultured Propionibacteriaceae bacterium]|uniref:Uncharacterized protein n=1 Tax=uncultured Propionibacteriaceae bacterium TaxID=257457 RepID=A0A6J4PIK0_9ACTN|nr:MAG: hypothetical protein AVDCRST_MAG75-3170 [uncultured Propionibacteriaceae bacterium]
MAGRFLDEAAVGCPRIAPMPVESLKGKPLIFRYGQFLPRRTERAPRGDGAAGSEISAAGPWSAINTPPGGVGDQPPRCGDQPPGVAIKTSVVECSGGGVFRWWSVPVEVECPVELVSRACTDRSNG